MMKLLRGLGILVFLLNSGCQTSPYEMPNLCPAVELAGTERGFEICTISKKEKIYSKKEWSIERKRRVSLSYRDWATVKKEYLKKCVSSNCKQVETFFDKLFKTIDKGISDAYEL